MKRIGIVTGTRAEYGILKPLIKKMYEDSELEVVIIATGMHFSEKFGMTYTEIEKDGFTIAHKVDMKLESDTAAAISNSMGLEMQGFAKVFEKESIDLVVILGDRFEILVAAMAAVMFRIPIAHLHGGEITEGLIDDAIRHSVTKMSQLHFVSTDTYRKRVIQMGEQPERVFHVGALGVENIKKLTLYTRKEVCDKFGDLFEQPYVMITYHPVTLEQNSAKWQFENLLEVIEKHPEYHYIFTYANADMDGEIVNQMIESHVASHDNAIAFKSMGQMGYLSALQFAEAVIGNSSSGLIEAPSFHIPTVNIGARQNGRVKADTVIDCGNTKEEIDAAMQKALKADFKEKCKSCSNPYEGEETSEEIIKEIKKYLKNYVDNRKKFYDIEDNR